MSTSERALEHGLRLVGGHGVRARGQRCRGNQRQLRRTEYLRVDGSLTIAGNLSLASSGGFDVTGDLRLAGREPRRAPFSWTATPGCSARPRRSATSESVAIFSSVRTPARLTRARDGRRGALEEPFTIVPPCDCDEAGLLDVPGSSRMACSVTTTRASVFRSTRWTPRVPGDADALVWPVCRATNRRLCSDQPADRRRRRLVRG